MTVTFMGLAGTGGVLPGHYTQLLIDRVREKDFGLRDFLDLFNHRLIAQFYRAWEKCHFFVGYESSQRRDREGAGSLHPDVVQPGGPGHAGVAESPGRSPTKFSCITPAISPIGRGRRSRWSGSFADMFRVPTADPAVPGPMDALRPADQTRLRAGRQQSVSACRRLPAPGLGHREQDFAFDSAR